MNIRIGIIGAGKVVRVRHLPETQGNSFAEVGAVCDIVESRATEMAELYDATAYTDYKDMLQDESLDAIIVAATNTTHAEMTIAALEAGKHVMCEKPMATNLEDARKMIQAAKISGKKLMIAHNQRLEPANKKAREILESGRLGRVLTFRSVFGHPGCEDWAIDGEDTWFFKKDITGLGCLGDLAVHKLDLIRWLMGDEYSAAFALTGTLQKTYPEGGLIDVEDNALCLLKTEKGALGTVIASWTYRKEENTTTFYCQNGIMELYGHPEFPLVIHYDHARSEYHKLAKKPSNVEQIKTGIVDAFVDAIVNDTEPIITGTDGFKALEAVLACLKASETGKLVEI